MTITVFRFHPTEYNRSRWLLDEDALKSFTLRMEGHLVDAGLLVLCLIKSEH